MCDIPLNAERDMFMFLWFITLPVLKRLPQNSSSAPSKPISSLKHLQTVSHTKVTQFNL